jgi:uncharacterized protein involved in exopolysaccharide biosynthesis
MGVAPEQEAADDVPRYWQPEHLVGHAWRSKGTLLLMMAVGAAVSAGIATALPPVYQSTTQFSVVKRVPDSVTGMDTRPLSTEESITPPQDVLKSSSVLENALRSAGINQADSVGEDGSSPTDRVRNALNVVPTKSLIGQSTVYKATYRGKDEAECRAVLSAVVESYQDFLKKKHQSVSGDTLELILREKDRLRHEIAEKEAAYREFREKAPLLGKSKDGLELRQERLNSIQAKRSALLLQKVEIEGQLTAVEAALKAGQSPDAILAMLVSFARKGEAAETGPGPQSRLEEQLFALVLEEHKLAKVHGAKHPEVLAIRDRIETARRLLVLPPTAWNGGSAATGSGGAGASLDPVALHVQVLRQRLSHLKVAEEMLAKVFQDEQDEVRRLAAFEIQNDAFRTSISLDQQLYEALVKRLSEVGMVRSAGGYQVEVIEPPSPGRRVGPSLQLTVGVGAFVGLLLGLALAVWFESRREQNRRRRDAARAAAVAVGDMEVAAVRRS